MKVPYTSDTNNVVFNKICNLYTGNGHFLVTVGKYIAQKVGKGSKVLIFTDDDIRSKLIEKSDCIGCNIDRQKLSDNVIQFPVKSIKEMSENKQFRNFICKIIGLMARYCSNEGVIICIHGAFEELSNIMIETEGTLQDIAVPVYFINCFSFSTDKKLAIDIMQNYEYILDTTGVRRIDSIFGNLREKLS
ncbi:MAG: hypothetical protein ACM3KR_00295 [Deltaproteobacteria bacterium]